MKNRDPFSSAAYFVSSLAKHPLTTLRDTFRGVMHGAGDLKPPYNYTTPSLGLIGSGLLVMGALNFSPLSIAFGGFSAADSGGRYLEIGQRLPPPPVPSPGPG